MASAHKMAEATLPPWLDARLASAFGRENKVRLEATLYGPLNSYLHLMFPPSSQFIIKPQGHLLPGKIPKFKDDEDQNLYLTDSEAEGEGGVVAGGVSGAEPLAGPSKSVSVTFAKDFWH